LQAKASKAQVVGLANAGIDRMRDLGQRFMKRTGRMPSMIDAGTYTNPPIR
jgi:hypothetical protein